MHSHRDDGNEVKKQKEGSMSCHFYPTPIPRIHHHFFHIPLQKQYDLAVAFEDHARPISVYMMNEYHQQGCIKLPELIYRLHYLDAWLQLLLPS